MTTKAPSAVQETPVASLEKVAYTSVSTIPTQEPNDRNRLGFHIWRFLKTRSGTLEQAVSESGSRLLIAHAEAVKIIRDALAQQGISF
jgi:hypothetical protein